MLIVKLETEENGARANQVIYPALDMPPEGWVGIPEKLEAKALELLPWMTLKLRGGVVTGVSDDSDARTAAAKLADMADADAEVDADADAGADSDVGADADAEQI